MQQESFGLMNLVTDVRGSAVTTRTQSSEMVEQSGRNRAHDQTLSSLVSDISQALDLIKSIAAQTNLLSVNANIEANRTGDAGRGVTGGAREIKSLAGVSDRTAGRIASRRDILKD